MRPFVCRFAAVLIAALALASCDNTAEEPPDEFELAPLPQGLSLFAGASGANARTSGSGGPVNYGCYLSSPNLGAPADERYQLSGALAHFPQEVVARARGRSRVVVLTIGSRTAYADVPRSVPVVLRQARCVIPDDWEAVTLLKESLARFVPNTDAQWEGEPMVTGIASASEGAEAQRHLAAALRTSSAGSYCEEVVVRVEWRQVCAGPFNGEPESCRWEATEVTETVCDSGGGGGFTGGGGGGSSPGSGTGSDPDPCEGPAVMPTMDQGGLGCGEPTPGVSQPPWDILDWAALGLTFAEFIANPGLATFGWLVLDTFGAVLPVVPSAGLFRHGARLLNSANDALKRGHIMVRAANGSTVPVPKGFVGRQADNGAGVVFQKPGSTGNANSVRIMDNTSRYPDGYVVCYSRGGQPLDRMGNSGYRNAQGQWQQYRAGDAAIHHPLSNPPPPGYADWFGGHN